MSSSKIQAYNLDDSVFDGVIEVLNSLQSQVDEMQNVISNLATKSDLANVGVAVKKIQRGTARTGNGDQAVADISLSGFTNLNKMFVILNGIVGSSSGSGSGAVYMTSLTTTKLSVKSNYYNSDFSYQVIELA